MQEIKQFRNSKIYVRIYIFKISNDINENNWALPSRPPLPRSRLHSPPHTPHHPPTSPSPAAPSSTLAPPSPASASPPLLSSVEVDVRRTPKRNRSV